MSGQPALVRALPEPHLEQMAADLSLVEFVRKPPGRRDFYFGTIRLQIERFEAYAHFPPPDGTVRRAVSITLETDRSFRAFVKNTSGSSLLATQAGSEDVHLAGAGAILCDYLRTECGVA